MAAIGSPSVPVYIDANGAARPCTNITPSSGGSDISAGVIDGTILRGPTQVDKTLSNSTATLLYTVVNDCYLYMECADASAYAGADIECHYWLDSAMTKPIFKTSQSSDAGSNPYAYQGTCVPLKAGSQIYGSAVVNTSQTRRFNFVEYKLNMLATPIGIPDWNNGEYYMTGTEITKNGILAFSCSTTLVHCLVAINSKSNIVQSFGYGASTGAVRSSTVIPVKEGDVVYVGHMDPTYGEDVSHIDWEDDVTSFNITTISAWWKFYPTKSAADNNLASVLDAVYPVGSVYITVGATLPESIAAIGTWQQLSTGKTLWNVNPSETTPGTEIAAGLPNITGNVEASDAAGTTDGAFYRTANSAGCQAEDPHQNRSVIAMDASRSNSIYGNSSTVQPPAVAVTMWKRTA